MKLLVTGASGFVGRRLCRDALARGISVRGAVRRNDVDLPLGSDLSIISDIRDESSWRRELDGVDVVIHAAARVHVVHEAAPDPLAAFRAVNVEGTRAVVRAAVKAGVKRFILVSSVKVHGEGKSVAYMADDTLDPCDAYGQSKAEAEAVLWDESADMAAAAVRPPLVYGSGVGGNFARLLNVSARVGRWPLPLGGITNKRSLVFVGNLTDALLHLATMTDAERITGAWLVSDGYDLSTSELLLALGRLDGGRLRLIRCPQRAARWAGRLLGRQAEIGRLLDSLTVDIRPLRSIGWEPRFSVEEGLRETAHWWLSQRKRTGT